MIVVDCSAVLDALVAADDNGVSDVLSAQRLAAPHLLDFEMVAALRSMVLHDSITAARAQDVLGLYDQLLITRWGSAVDLRSRALALRDNVSAYDAAYVALAEALGCPLITRDHRLARAAADICDIQVL